VHPKDPIWHHYEPFKWWLLPHGLAGACALLLGPMQFSDRLRMGYAKLHRVVGRIYIAGVFIVAPLGTYIQYFQERTGGPRSFSIAAAVDGALLMITTGIALGFILKGRVQPHRQWMTRSFAVALVFLEGRVISGITGMGESWRGRQRNHCTELPCVLRSLGGHCASVAGVAAAESQAVGRGLNFLISVISIRSGAKGGICFPFQFIGRSTKPTGERVGSMQGSFDSAQDDRD
jgi:hypothetical protein